MKPGPAFGRVYFGHGVAVERVGAQAINRLCPEYESTEQREDKLKSRRSAQRGKSTQHRRKTAANNHRAGVWWFRPLADLGREGDCLAGGQQRGGGHNVGMQRESIDGRVEGETVSVRRREVERHGKQRGAHRERHTRRKRHFPHFSFSRNIQCKDTGIV